MGSQTDLVNVSVRGRRCRLSRVLDLLKVHLDDVARLEGFFVRSEEMKAEKVTNYSVPGVPRILAARQPSDRTDGS
jgi:hypothetical protein